MSYFEPPQPDYDKYSTLKLLFIPVLVFVIALFIMLFWFTATGYPFDRAIEFTGGTEVRVDYNENVVDNPEERINNLFGDSASSITPISSSNSYIITFSEGSVEPENIERQIENENGLSVSELSSVSPSLGDDSQIKALQGIFIAFILMSILVIGLFRSIIPAFVIILSVISDISISIGFMNIAGVPLSFGTVGALLMLIGYSVDSDILMNTYVLRSDNLSFNESVLESIRTGFTMTVTSLSAMVVMFLTASYFGIGLLADMGLVLSIGLVADLINTYMMNVSILRLYVNKKGDLI